MITMLAGQIFLEAGVLCFLLFLVARHEADYSFAKVAMVTAGITTGSLLIEGLLSEKLGPWTVVPVVGFVIFMLMTFCWVSFGRSLLVVVLFGCVHVALAMGVSALSARLESRLAEQSPVGREDMELAKQFLEEVDRTLTTQARKEAEAREKARLEQAGSAIQRPQTGTPSLDGTVRTSADKASWAGARQALKVGGIMGSSDSGFVAMIQGSLTEAGETVSVVYDDKVFRWRVRAISRDDIALVPLDVRLAKAAP